MEIFKKIETGLLGQALYTRSIKILDEDDSCGKLWTTGLLGQALHTRSIEMLDEDVNHGK